jgi:hypothetical protein
MTKKKKVLQSKHQFEEASKEQLLPGQVQPQLPAAEPQLSSNSSSSDVRSGTSSSTNSDSGIGYRDDPDHILLMDPQSPPTGMPLVESNENEILV